MEGLDAEEGGVGVVAEVLCMRSLLAMAATMRSEDVEWTN